MKTLTVSKNTLLLIDKYMQLPIGKCKVVCPYFINSKKRKAELRALIGKGTYEEIVEEVLIYSKIKGFDIYNSNEEQIRHFMISIGIGIDCSGLVCYLLEEELKTKNMSKLVNLLKFKDNSLKVKLLRYIRPIQNISADDLTSELNTKSIDNSSEVLPNDLIRAHAENGGMHVAMVTKVVKDDSNRTIEFEYVNSTRWYEDKNGLRIGKIIIKDPNKDLSHQEWLDEENGINWFRKEFLIDPKDSGVRRLLFI